jgi:regulator of cell morphogenesis and NO signaling
MSVLSPVAAAALVADITERFHDAHRRDLAELSAQVRALPASPEAAALQAQLEAFGAALERHLFKEEMRLFPMIEQGGSPLIGALIDDITREHAEHEAAVAALRARHRALPLLPPAQATPLHHRLERFLHELAEHAALEESVLFAPFAGAPRRGPA